MQFPHPPVGRLTGLATCCTWRRHSGDWSL